MRMALSYDKRKPFRGVGGGGISGTFTIWSAADTPANPTDASPNPVTLGCRFRADVPGDVIGVRFYKGDATNAGPHEGLLYDNAGALLNSVTFAGETASGWQEQLFAVPTPILAATTYMIAYFAPSGHNSFDHNYFAAAGFDNPPLHALQDGADGINGAFTLAAVPTFPANVFLSSNYWVDLVFQV